MTASVLSRARVQLGVRRVLVSAVTIALLAVVGASGGGTLAKSAVPMRATELHLSDDPTESDFFRAGLFAEPLVPVGSPSAEENRDLARALMAYDAVVAKTGARDRVEPILAFLATRPESCWKPVLLLNLGTVYRRTGHFSKALSTWQAAWDVSKVLTDKHGHAIGDAAVSALSQFEAYLGRKELLQPLLDEVKSRRLRGAAVQFVANSVQGLSDMLDRPETSFRCGPLALSSILHRSADPSSAAGLKILDDAKSTPIGLSLRAVQQMSKDAGMNYQMAFRSPGAGVLLPAVAHWQVGHYAAIVEKDDQGRYFVEDPTFGEAIRMSLATLEDEASGYFLVPPGRLPAGWRPVSPAEGSVVWGRGDTGLQHDDGATGPSAPPAFSGPGAPPGAPGGAPPGAPPDPPHPCPGPGGCTTWNVEASVVGLSLHDAPVGYAPSLGPPVRFEIYYSQRDVLQPMTGFPFTNLGPSCTSTLTCFVTDNGLTDPNTVLSDCPAVGSTGITDAVRLYNRGGGDECYLFQSSATSMPGVYSQAMLTRTTGSSGTQFVRQLPDGSMETFSQPFGTAQWLLTSVADPQGNAVTIGYDSLSRIASLSDASGRVTNVVYSGTGTEVQKVTDPFGRSATFIYDSSGHLSSVMDVLGITSTYAYGSSTDADFVTSLTTPYGTTTFTSADGNGIGTRCQATNRYVQIVDPMGQTSRVEFCQLAPGVPAADSAVPAMNVTNSSLSYRNTYVWDPLQYEMAANNGVMDYTKGKILHWLHTPSGPGTYGASRVLESAKAPLENRVWYLYPGQSEGSIYTGTSNKPTYIGRVLPDGTSQIWAYTYNSIGRPLTSTDPLGRQLTYTYASNNIDLLTVTNATSTTTPPHNDLLASFAQYTNHRPFAYTATNGNIWQMQYTASGQLKYLIDKATTRYLEFLYSNGGLLILLPRLALWHDRSFSQTAGTSGQPSDERTCDGEAKRDERVVEMALRPRMRSGGLFFAPRAEGGKARARSATRNA